MNIFLTRKIYFYKYFILTIFYIFLQQDIFAQNIKNNDFENMDGVSYLDDKNDIPKFSSVATIQILNKTTAKNSIIDLNVGQINNLGPLSIISHKCWQAPLDQKPETKILLEVFENKNIDAKSEKDNIKRIFYGWIFASSPSISGIQHPIYDIVAIGCKK